LCKKYSVSFGGRILFFLTLILFTLRSKMNKISVLKKIILPLKAAKYLGDSLKK